MNNNLYISKIQKQINEFRKTYINTQKMMAKLSIESKKITKQWESIGISIKKESINFKERYEIAYNEIFQNIDILAKNGWTIPINFTFAETINLIKLNDSEKINNILLNYYTCSENKTFNNMANSLLECNILSKWKTLLYECIKAFNQKMYTITIPSLLTILEGMMTKILEKQTHVRMIGPCEKKFEEQEDFSVDKLLWYSYYKFVKELYSKKPFDQPQPYILNRNWILHGRSSTEWDISDSLRIFVSIETLKTILL
jgi:hypothetical protein